MRILMGYRYGEVCPADRMKLAFEKLGHEVVVAGPSADQVICHEIEVPDILLDLNAGLYYYDVTKIVKEWGKFDLILQVEPGVFLFNVGDATPFVVWWIDTFTQQDHPFIQDIGGEGWIDSLDWIFTSKLPHVPEYHRHGIRKVSHLALAYDEEIHREFSAEKVFDVVFCGNTAYGERKYFFDELKSKYRVFFEDGFSGTDYSCVIAYGKIAFNHGHIGEMNMRFFELFAMGAFQVCNVVQGQESFGFIDGVHLVNYIDDRNLLEVVEYYLHEEKERDKIAQAGKRKVLDGHSYLDRAKEILRKMELI